MRAFAPTDVVIIGLGAAGGIAAHVLTRSGLRVVGLEAGPHLTNEDFITLLDEISGCHVRNTLGEPKYNAEMPTWRSNGTSAATDAPSFHNVRMMNAVGGTSVHYGALSWRMSPGDFRVRTDTIIRYGDTALPGGSNIVDWPLRYGDLEQYYDHVEYSIGVSGRAGINPFEGPRSRDYPMPPLRMAGYCKLAESAMRKLGFHPFPAPSAINSVERDGRAACSYCGFCSGYPCWNDSKASTLVTVIKRAEKTGLLDVRPRSSVTRILTTRAGKINAVEYRTASGDIVEQPTKFVVLSAYIYENVRRLLLSKSETFPNGLSNNHGQVGRNYMAHAYLNMRGLFPGRNLNLFNGTPGQSIAFDDLNGDNFDHTGLGFIRGAAVSVFNQNLPIAAATILPPDVPKWGQTYKDWLKANANSVGSIETRLETLPYESNYLDLDQSKADPFGDPVIRITYDLYENEKRAGIHIAGHLERVLRAMGATNTWLDKPVLPVPINSHAFGGTRMGNDPTQAVVDRYCISHEVQNLAVLGGSVFPSTSAYNPTQTIQALSWRSAEYIAANFGHLTN
jgi:gluconate 2-dehydrogenase alpha chain